MLQCGLRVDVWLSVHTSLQLCAEVCLRLGIADALKHRACKEPDGAAQYGITPSLCDPCKTILWATGALDHGADKGPNGDKSLNMASHPDSVTHA